MSLSILDKIKLKTQQILVKTDDYLRESNTFGPKASMHGMAFAGTAVMTGILGVAAMIAAPALPAIAGVAAIASMPTALAIGGASINLAGASLLAGGAGGIAFAGLAKLYNAVRGTQDNHVSGEFECILRDKEKNPSVEMDKVFNNIELDNVVRVSRKEVLKSIENGTFHEKYAGIRLNNPDGPGKTYCKVDANDDKSLEKVTTLPYKYGGRDEDIYVRNAQWKEECKTVRRECFKEAKSFDLKSKILNRIKVFRDEVEGPVVKSTYSYR